MDLHDPNWFSYRKPTLPSRERFLGIQNPSSSAATHDDDFFSNDHDLIEDDVVFSHNDDFTEPSSSSSPIPNLHNHNNHHKGLAFAPSDGILAALPENDHASPNSSHLFHHKPSVSVSVSLSSSASSSSARLIPAIPKLPPDRTPSSSLKFHQSAPVNVPLMPRRRHHRREFDDDDGDDDAAEEEEEMLPPHELVARNSAQSPMLACSVLEGVGRTLKGRDLRQVRNAVWRQTGIKVSAKCECVKKLRVVTTKDKGFFKVELPSESAKCFIKLVGDPNHM